jgi:hypothetical protein
MILKLYNIGLWPKQIKFRLKPSKLHYAIYSIRWLKPAAIEKQIITGLPAFITGFVSK